MLSGVLVFASCGGSSVSRDEYVVEANAICVDATRRMDDVSDPVFTLYLPQIGEAPTDEQAMGFYALFVDLESELRGIPRAMLSGLRSLERPADSEDIEDLWAVIEQRFDDEWGLLVGASESGEAARTQLASGSPFEDLNSRAVEVGLVGCVFDQEQLGHVWLPKLHRTVSPEAGSMVVVVPDAKRWSDYIDS